MSNATNLAAVAVAGSLLALAAPARADDIVCTDGTELAGLTVRAITADAVACDGRDPLPRTGVREVRFTAFDVAPKTTGAVLRSGDRLGGVVRKLGPEWVEFRSVAAGPLRLPRADLARVYWDIEAAAAPFAAPAADPAAAATVVCRDASVQCGQVMWADADSAGLLTPTGLVTIPAAKLCRIDLTPAATPAARVRLRNGDCLTRVVGWDGQSLAAELGGQRVQIPLSAVREIRF